VLWTSRTLSRAGYHIRTHPSDDYFIDFPQDADLMGGVHGTEAVRRMVREMVSRGVNRIKVMATERAGTAGDRSTHPDFQR